MYIVTEKIQTLSPLVDQFSRTISYLRLSLTDRCNLRCLYCMPEEEGGNPGQQVKGGAFLQHRDLLSYEELLRVVRLAVSLGMNKIRLTGGEPLVRRGVLDFIHQLFRIPGLDEVRLTTNGVLLADHAERLWAEGVRHLNVSLDTLQREKFVHITGRDFYHKVRQGIDAADRLGFHIKLNIVAMRGVNDDEFLDFGRLALTEPFQVRFIEFMPVGEKSSWHRDQFIGAEEIKSRIAGLGQMQPFQRKHSEGPARMYQLIDAQGRKGVVGFISPISHHFCDQCNRLRLTSEGKLRACLLNDQETDLKALLRSGAADREIVSRIKQTIFNKPKGHTLQDGIAGRGARTVCSGRMSRIGG